jgi:YD repeat-containing protein
MAKKFLGFALTGILFFLMLLPAGASAAQVAVRYVYDRRGQVHAVYYENGMVTDYIYDSSGNRISRTVSNAASVNSPPGQPNNIFPPDSSSGQPLTVQFEWNAVADPDPGDIVTYDLYVGASIDPPLVGSGIRATTFTIRLSALTRYYWRVDARDNRNNVTSGTVWSFVTTDDSDADGFADSSDNCPYIFNPASSWVDINGINHQDEQPDMDLDGSGDACDTDKDGDGIDLTVPDNCPSIPNPLQQDLDGDGYGDDCDDDDDGDGIRDSYDNCVRVFNPLQTDIDSDGIGNDCDTDMDGDWIPDLSDNCPAAANGAQKDMDGDGTGDRCDTDMDGDGVDNIDDNCPFDPNASQDDSHGMGFGDSCTIYHCVSDSAGLQSALTVARNNGVNDVIRIESGIYRTADNNNLRFRYSSTEPYSIVVEGGYSAGCSVPGTDPSYTVVDGMIDAQADIRSSKVIEIIDAGLTDYDDWLGIANVKVVVRLLDVRNGKSGMYIKSFSGDVSVEDCNFIDNGDSSWGGLKAAADEGDLFVRRCLISGNVSAYKTGAYVETATGHIEMENNVITGNEARAGNGGGVYALVWNDGGEFRLINNTIAGNSCTYAPGKGGGMYLKITAAAAPVIVANNIFWNNAAHAGDDIYIENPLSSVIQIRGNDVYPAYIYGNYTAAGNVYLDPVFLDSSGGDYRLSSASPLIDLADASFCPLQDFEGDPRPVDGDGDSSAVPDIGADEFIPSSPDSDIDGVSDIIDNCRYTANPGQEDTDGDGFGNACDADLDNDGFVGPNDFTLFALAWWSGTSSAHWNPDADLDSDGFVGPFDYTMFSMRWWTEQPWY